MNKFKLLLFVIFNLIISFEKANGNGCANEENDKKNLHNSVLKYGGKDPKPKYYMDVTRCAFGSFWKENDCICKGGFKNKKLISNPQKDNCSDSRGDYTTNYYYYTYECSPEDSLVKTAVNEIFNGGSTVWPGLVKEYFGENEGNRVLNNITGQNWGIGTGRAYDHGFDNAAWRFGIVWDQRKPTTDAFALADKHENFRNEFCNYVKNDQQHKDFYKNIPMNNIWVQKYIGLCGKNWPT